MPNDIYMTLRKKSNEIESKYDKAYHKLLLNNEVSNSRRNRLRLKELLSHKRSGHLLEVGSGQGGFLKLAQTFYGVECIEISDYALQSLQTPTGINTIQTNCENVSLPQNTYDFIVLFNVLEHLKRPRNVILKIKDSLVDDGIVLGSVPNNSGLLGKLVTFIGNYFDKTHYSTYSVNKRRKIFEDSNYKKVSFFGELIFCGFCKYIRNRYWKYFSINAMFICQN